ncbi:hypothetical protein AX16_008617 [Volvariella volvacea WC 439]|nr:hypothetical protein AX16_008617 [Volvariella volvacea WC 439]
MHPHQSQQRTGPRFSAGGGSWSRPSGSRRRDQSDSDTEQYRSLSRSDLSSRRNSATSPEDRAPGSFESVPDAPYWSAKRHLTCGNPTTPPWSAKTIPWRGSSPGKLKTANAALVLCLNIDVDPPDVVKTNPCAVLECWVDPHTMPSHKALEAIGSNLQHQFEGLSMKISYKPILDPSLEDLRRFCQTLRKQAKDDAVLFYYNGHGVPKPTASGELWCFNRNYTQYIPVSLQEVQSWLGSPGVYIWDCSAAGHLLQNFNAFAERKDQEMKLVHGGYADGAHPMMDSLQLAACAANEQLPTCPELPADVFTSCLTSPIDIALRYFIMNHQLPNNITADMVMQLPGDLKDRRTPLGELNWLFTAITDTIAWTTFSRDIFTRLYRCDLLIASLFRNFLLAERIMKNYHCTPHTWPPLPPTNTHPLWATWDLAVDACLRQLPDLLFKTPDPSAGPTPNSARAGRIGQTQPKYIGKTSDKPYAYQPSRFFADQLTAFEVWISRGGSALTKRGPMSLPHDNRFPNAADMSLGAGTGPNHHLVPRKPPDQLPIVLQVLLSQPHRLRALILLSQFVDLGPWAVHLVLTIGIFPYISKLLQAAGPDLRPVLIFIWARILAVDPSVQTDLYNTQGYKYFAQALALRDDGLLPNSSEHKAMCSFILAAISRDFPHGQAACWGERVFDSCYDRLEEPDFLLRQWTALCIAQMWDGNFEIKVYGVDRGTQDKLVAMLSDDSAEVRAAALYALGTFMGASGSADPKKRGGGGTGTMYQLEERVHFRMEVAVATGATLAIKDDASPMCRKELLVVISCLVHEWRGYFVVCAWIYWEEDRKWRMASQGGYYAAAQQQHDDDFLTSQAVAEWLDTFTEEEREENRVLLSSFFTIFVVLLDLSVDPYSEVATMAQTIVDYIMALLLESPFTKLESTSLHASPIAPIKATSQPQQTQGPYGTYSRSRVPSLQGPLSAAGYSASPLSARPSISRSDTMTTSLSGVGNTLRRSPSIPSIASTLKNIANGIMFPSSSSTTNALNEEVLRTSMPSPLGASSFTANNLPQGGSKDHQVDISRPPSPNLNIAKYSSPYGKEEEEEDGEREKESIESPDGSSANGHGFGRGVTPQPQEQQQQVRFGAYDVIEALMEEDMERLRARRRLGLHPTRRAQYEASRSHHSHGHGHGHHGHSSQYHGHGHGQGGHSYYQGSGGLPSPSNSTFSVDSNNSVILGLGTGAGIKDVLPLKSGYYDWCCEYFKEPQMRQTEADEPGSVEYNYQVWRQQRNEQVIGETMQQSMYAHTCRWDRPVAHFQVSTLPLTMRFHAYDPHLIMANESDMISVWDWSQRKRLNYFCNGNAKGTTITAMNIINQDVGGIVVTAAADGIVRLFRNYDSTLDQGPVQMVSAFRALNEVIQLRQGSGVVMDWKQSAGTLLVGGDARIIKVWDAQTETASADIETGLDSPLTAIESDPTHTQTFIAGFGDGVVKVFDRRIDEDEEATRSRKYLEHTSWIQSVKWNPSSPLQFYSASIDGEVKLWDIRLDTPIKTWTVHAGGLSAWDAHPLTPVFAAGRIRATIVVQYWNGIDADASPNYAFDIYTEDEFFGVPSNRDAICLGSTRRKHSYNGL